MLSAAEASSACTSRQQAVSRPRVAHAVPHVKQWKQQQPQIWPCRRSSCRQSTSQDFSTSTTSTTCDAELTESPSTSGRIATEQILTVEAHEFITFEEVQQLAANRGLHISLKTLGPGYRIICRDGGEGGKILGVTSGFVAPLFGLMHCDTLQIFTKGLKGSEGLRVRRNALGLGLLLGAAVFAHGRRCGCSKAEILAINDDDSWHERLVRYYRYFGFKPVCKVGGNGFFADVPHLLVWGGEGTRMDADICAMLAKWTPALRKGSSRGQSSGGSVPPSE
eukprot:gene11133-11286_t